MTELPGLIVPIEARINKLEQGFAKANRAQHKASGQMERRAEQSANRMSASYGKAGKKISAAFTRMIIPALAAAASIQTARRIATVTKSVAALGDEAKRAGVSAQALQEWKFVGEQNRIPIDAVVDGLKELNLRADEFILTSKGPAAEAFERLGYSTDQLSDKLKNPSELLLEIIGKMGDLDDAARIRISDEIFGGSAGERFSELVGRGESALRDTIKAAHDTGVVLDDELIAKADELDRKFSALQSRASTAFKQIAVGAADAADKVFTLRTDVDDLFRSMDQAEGLLGTGIAETLENDSDKAKEHARVIGMIRGEYEALSDAVDQQASAMMQGAALMRNLGYGDVADEIYNTAQNMLELSGQLEDGTISADEFEKQMGDVTDQAQTALGEINAIDRSTFAGVIGGLGGLITKLGEAAARARDLRKELPGAEVDGRTKPRNYEGSGANPSNAYGASATTPQAVKTSLRPQLPSVNASFGIPDADTGGGSGGGGGSARQSDLEREIESIRQESEALRLEATAINEVAGARGRHADALEFARTKAELLAAATRSGVQITPELLAQVDALAGEYTAAGVEAETAADKIAEVQAASQRGAQSVASVFEGMATGAMTAKEAIGKLILEVLKLSLKKRLLESAAGSTGILSKVFSVLGGGFASGGYTGDGPKLEPAGIVHRGEFVMSKAATSAIGADTLAGLHSAALRGYSGGGLVGAAKALNTRAGTRTAGQGGNGPTISISAPVTVEGSSGTPEQNQDLAKRMAREMEMTMRGTVVSELQRQLRPGNMLNKGRG